MPKPDNEHLDAAGKLNRTHLMSGTDHQRVVSLESLRLGFCVQGSGCRSKEIRKIGAATSSSNRLCRLCMDPYIDAFTETVCASATSVLPCLPCHSLSLSLSLSLTLALPLARSHSLAHGLAFRAVPSLICLCFRPCACVPLSLSLSLSLYKWLLHGSRSSLGQELPGLDVYWAGISVTS